MESTQIDLLAESLSKLTAKIKKEEEILIDKISYYDTMLSEFYHLFESTRLPAHLRAKLDKKFDNCLKERRLVKDEYSKIVSIKSKLKTSALDFDTINLGKRKVFTVKILKDEFQECSQYIKENWKISE